MTQNCPLCAPEGEHVIVENDKFRIIRVDDPEFPGYFRLIWQDHLKEVSDLDPGDRLVMWDALTRLEEAVIEAMHPEKVNWAQFGTMVPHLHWHLIPRSRTATGVREEEKPIPKYWQNASRQHGGVQNSLKRGLLKFDTLSFQGGANVLGHKSADIAAHHGDLSDKCSADELKLFRRREEDRFNFRHEFLVHSGHLEFVFKIADGAGPADDAG